MPPSHKAVDDQLYLGLGCFIHDTESLRCGTYNINED